jgi:hypothetical protein
MRFDVKASAKTNELLNSMASSIFYKKNIMPKINLVGFGLVAKEAVEQALANKFGEKAKHFKVSTTGSNQHGLRIVIMADQVGMFLFEGTPDHLIYPNGAQALHFVWNGESVFFESVDNPGIKAIGKELEKVVNAAVIKAMKLYG